MSHDLYHPGLRGVIAGETEICRLSHGIQYRGYCLSDLSSGATFLEVAYLLLYEELPTEEQFADFISVIQDEQSVPTIVEDLFEQIPVNSNPIEVLRTGISILSHFDPAPEDDLLNSSRSQAIRLLARIPWLIGAWNRVRNGQPVLTPRPELSYVGNLYYLVTGNAPNALYEHALEVAMIVCAEHEFNPSTYVARVVGSTRTDHYGPVLGALNAFLGSEHGGGNDGPLDILNDVISPQHVNNWYASLGPREPIPGFGHSVHTEYDPRAALIEVECERLAQSCGRTDLEELAEAIERKVWKQRQQSPNVDWPLARLFSYLELERDLFRAMFVSARVVGWSAHAFEQCETGEIIRPRARYRGAEDRTFENLRRRVD